MEIYLESIDFYNDEVRDIEDNLIGITPDYVKVEYKWFLNNQILTGEANLAYRRYKGFSGHDEIIEYIKKQIKVGLF